MSTTVEIVTNARYIVTIVAVGTVGIVGIVGIVESSSRSIGGVGKF